MELALLSIPRPLSCVPTQSNPTPADHTADGDVARTWEPSRN
jgi:hypothetical protein